MRIFFHFQKYLTSFPLCAKLKVIITKSEREKEQKKRSWLLAECVINARVARLMPSEPFPDVFSLGKYLQEQKK
jgi:hypothetical protein